MILNPDALQDVKPEDMHPGKVVYCSAPEPTPLCLDFPIRKGFLAQIVVPPNLTTAEAKRLCAFVETLVIPESAHNGGEPRG